MDKLSRRQALAGAAAGFGIASKTARAAQANSAVTLGIIGTGGRGRFDLALFAKDGRARIVALCDISSEAIDKTKTAVSGTDTARVYKDYRELLADPSIDAVLIATPVFLHPEHFEAAVQARKHIYIEKPDFLWRNRGPSGALWGAPSGPTEMHARELLLGITPEHQREGRLWERHNKWGGWRIYGGHSLGEIFPPEKYAQHPDYYALVKGKRAVPGPNYDYKHGGQVCTTNPAVVEAAAEWVNQFYDGHPDCQAVHVTMNDGGGFCECGRCRALDFTRATERAGIDAEESKSGGSRTIITDRIYTFVNQVAERVQKRHPGKYVVSMAYSRYIMPPEKIRLNPYVIPQYCMWGAYRHANPELQREHESIAAAWAKAARMAGVYEYYINGSWPGLHRLVVPYLSESIRYLKQQGIRLYQTQSGDEFGTNGLNYWEFRVCSGTRREFLMPRAKARGKVLGALPRTPPGGVPPETPRPDALHSSDNAEDARSRALSAHSRNRSPVVRGFGGIEAAGG